VFLVLAASCPCNLSPVPQIVAILSGGGSAADAWKPGWKPAVKVRVEAAVEARVEAPDFESGEAGLLVQRERMRSLYLRALAPEHEDQR